MYLVSRNETFSKLFFIISITGLVTYIVLAFYTFQQALTTITHTERFQERLRRVPKPEVVLKEGRSVEDFKYILLWTNANDKLDPIAEGQKAFITNNCSYSNCFLTTKKDFLDGDYKNFDAVIYNISVLKRWKRSLPKSRSPKQKYVFFGMLPSDDYPVCNIMADSYFNWTWSYKLYSDIVTPFIEVRDSTGNVVAPHTDVKWNLDTIIRNNNTTVELRTKTKALVWVVEKCDTKINTMMFVKQLQSALKEHSLVFDIYGCGLRECPREGCLKAIERDYYFYLAYEDSISEDYVTKEVLKAYNHDAVPIVMGGADYSKFLPEGSYINAHYSTVDKLAALIDYTIRIPSVYNNFHRWRNYYTIHEYDSFKGYCTLCALLHDKDKFENVTFYETFRKWWYYGSLKERCYPKGAESLDDVLSYMNSTIIRNRK